MSALGGRGEGDNICFSSASVTTSPQPKEAVCHLSPMSSSLFSPSIRPDLCNSVSKQGFIPHSLDLSIFPNSYMMQQVCFSQWKKKMLHLPWPSTPLPESKNILKTHLCMQAICLSIYHIPSLIQRRDELQMSLSVRK